MERKILIKKLKEKYVSLDEKYVELVVDKFFQTIAKSLKNDERIEIRNFGVFKLKRLNEREIFNPHTEQLHKVPGKSLPAFRCSKNLHKISA